MRARLTSEGWMVLGIALLLAALGVITVRPAIFGLGLLGGLWLGAAAAYGWWNMRTVQAVRRLPADLFADGDAPGALIVRGRGVDLAIEEADGSAAASVREAAGEEEIPVRWTFPDRGLHHLGGLLVRSRHPFGWIDWTKALEGRAEIVVWPKLGRASAERGALPIPAPDEDDFIGLREYRPGDPPRSIHWRTTARVGTPMVALRRGEANAPRWIRVELLSGRVGERRLSDAAAEILDAAEDGRPVGMILGDDRIEPAIGRGHVRRLLDRLAMTALPP